MLQPGLMMDQPLLLSSVIEHAAAQYGDARAMRHHLTQLVGNEEDRRSICNEGMEEREQ